MQVIKQRRLNKVPLGTGGVTDLEWAIRAHANFSEYVPITLILFACAEFNHIYSWLLYLLALLFFSGRALHAYAFINSKRDLKLRVYGMHLTIWTIFGLSLLNLGILVLNVFR